jgi:predicted tellurium resistance membrane protein TerC
MNEALISLLTLTLLEIVLGIDNIIFITIISARVPFEEQKKARIIGILLGMFVRILMLLGINWIQRQDFNLFFILNHGISGKDLLLMLGGLFLLYQSVHEIHKKMKGELQEEESHNKVKGWKSLIFQMLIINTVFSLDSVVTAVGMADHLWVMVIAVLLSLVVMLIANEAIANFVNNNPSIKILALAFLILIGVSLIAEAFEQELNKGYIYFAMAFSFIIELINLRVDKKKLKK